jgi:CheY-like chemotaxis protein
MNQRQTTILLTDDDEDDRYFIRQAIERTIHNSTILEATTGEEALDLLGRYIIQLVIMDMNMPGLNGLETLTFIRSKSPLLATPVVMLSTSDQPELITLAYARGINSFIKKPISIGEYDQIADALKVCFLSLPSAGKQT